MIFLRNFPFYSELNQSSPESNLILNKMQHIYLGPNNLFTCAINDYSFPFVCVINRKIYTYSVYRKEMWFHRSQCASRMKYFVAFQVFTERDCVYRDTKGNVFIRRGMCLFKGELFVGINNTNFLWNRT